MIEPANLPIVFGQVAEVSGLSDALQKNFHATVTAILLFAVLFLYREVAAERVKRFQDLAGYQAEVKAQNLEIRALYKELIPVISQTNTAVAELGRIAERFTREG
jgi:low temperature requirement protein LtrA